jgi:phage protein D
MTRHLALAGAAAFVLAHADGGRLQALVDGQPLSPGRVLSIDVDCGLLAPLVCAATVTVPGGAGREKQPPAGAALGVDATSDGSAASIFKGEIISVEPVFEEGGETKVVVRALNRLHRLTRGRKTRTFENKSDAEIAAQIASEAGLAFGPAGSEISITHDHVFQHNQTDLEFLRVRAARIGYEVLVDDWTLLFQRHADPPPTLLGCAPTSALPSARLQVFHPRLSSVNSVSKVTVRGWDPAKQEEIPATATRPVIPLSPAGRQVINPPGSLLDLGFVRPLETAAVSYGAAIGTLTTLTAGEVSAEVDADGNAALSAGARVLLEGAGQAFNGEYQVVRATHRYGRASSDGWHTLLQLARADRGMYVLPEVGDEVLVAFEHGDLAHPIVVGSLWNGETPPPTEEPVCRPGSRRQ